MNENYIVDEGNNNQNNYKNPYCKSRFTENGKIVEVIIEKNC